MVTQDARLICFSSIGRLYAFAPNKTNNRYHLQDIKTIPRVLIISLFLCLPVFGCAKHQTASEPALVELVRIAYEQETGAIVTELLIPDIEGINQSSRIELLISQLNQTGDSEAKFAVMLNHSDRVDPIPPGNFGVIIDPSSDDRSIKNVASAAGLPGRFDHDSAHGILRKQSVSGVVNGDLGVSIWITPRDWALGRYAILARATERKFRQTPWQQLAEINYSDKGVVKITQEMCQVKPIFINTPYESVMAFDQLRSVTLIRYDKQPQDEGVTIKRWSGDTAGEYKYVEVEKYQLKLNDIQDGNIPLEPGLYQFKHNSVSGQPPSGYYGESNIFEIKPGEMAVDIEVSLYPAI